MSTAEHKPYPKNKSTQYTGKRHYSHNIIHILIRKKYLFIHGNKSGVRKI